MILLGGTLLLSFLPALSGPLPAFLISAAFTGVCFTFFGLHESRQLKDTARTPSFKGEMRLAASLQEAVIIVDQRQQIVHMNPSAHKLFPNIRAGSNISTLSVTSNLNELVEDALAGKSPRPYIYQIFDPVERHIRVTGSALKPENSEPISRAIIVFYDVTDLERANAVRADFLANASHELKTPVASLLGYIETLNGHAKDDPEARGKFLKIMQQQAERMQRLISDILSLRRIELSEHKAPTETADLYLAFLAAKEAVMPMADQRNVSITYSGPEELLVVGKQDELVQLILNIVDNAVKISSGRSIDVEGSVIEKWESAKAFPKDYMAEGSSRRRIVNPPQTGISYAQLRIRDHGPGFDKEHLPRLSERFYRIAGDRSSAEKGTGLGLAIVKHIVLRHRGGLMVESAEKIGTEFFLVLPVSTQSNERPGTEDDNRVFVKFTNLS